MLDSDEFLDKVKLFAIERDKTYIIHIPDGIRSSQVVGIRNWIKETGAKILIVIGGEIIVVD